jgi:hypothetical protein
MRERWAMKWLAAIVGTLLLVLFNAEPGVAQPSGHEGFEALAQVKPKRARPRIVVRPRYPYRHYHALYPPPYDVEYPGPNAHRECSGGFATEYRASGPVIVPRLNCWWAAGRYPGP